MSIALRSSDWRKRDVCPGRPPLIASTSVMGTPSGVRRYARSWRDGRFFLEQRMDA
jgi:hypothetical protein